MKRRALTAALLVGALGWLGAGAALLNYLSDDHTDQQRQGSAIAANRALIKRINREGIARRDQTCRGWEQSHRQEIRDLERSYAFYTDPDPPPALRELLNSPVALASLAERVRNASNDRDPYGQFVPDYCDEPGAKAERLYRRTHGARGAPPVGAREPDPKVPRPPASLARVLKRR